jgi:hypothetical protein
MTMTTRAILCVALAIGCTAPDEPKVATVRQNIASENALGVNRLAMNRLAMNRLAMNRLAMNRLAMNGLMQDAELGGEEGSMLEMLQGNPEAVELMHYVVSCALPEGQNIEIPKYQLGMEDAVDDSDMEVFYGLHGLAPEWGNDQCRAPFTRVEHMMAESGDWWPSEDGSGGACPRAQCDEVCQRWVSACLFARANAVGISVPISMRGPHPALDTTPQEVADYPLQEGAFWGNWFDGTGMYACYGSHRMDDIDGFHDATDPDSASYLAGVGLPSAAFRHCAHKGSSCPMEILGPCGAGPAIVESASGDVPADYTEIARGHLTGSYRDWGVAGVALDRWAAPDGQESFDYNTVGGMYTLLPGPGPQTRHGTAIGITVYLRSPDPGMTDRYTQFDQERDIELAFEALSNGGACGNGVCDFGESRASCAIDCAGYQPPPEFDVE